MCMDLSMTKILMCFEVYAGQIELVKQLAQEKVSFQIMLCEMQMKTMQKHLRTDTGLHFLRQQTRNFYQKFVILTESNKDKKIYYTNRETVTLQILFLKKEAFNTPLFFIAFSP